MFRKNVLLCIAVVMVLDTCQQKLSEILSYDCSPEIDPVPVSTVMWELEDGESENTGSYNHNIWISDGLSYCYSKAYAIDGGRLEKLALEPSTGMKFVVKVTCPEGNPEVPIDALIRPVNSHKQKRTNLYTYVLYDKPFKSNGNYCYHTNWVVTATDNYTSEEGIYPVVYSRVDPQPEKIYWVEEVPAP